MNKNSDLEQIVPALLESVILTGSTAGAEDDTAS
jgi:hypothetical protein